MDAVICRASARTDHEMFIDLARVVEALASPPRLESSWRPAEAERDVRDLASLSGQSLPVMSHHLARLRQARMVGVRRHGRRRVDTCSDGVVIALVEVALSTHQPQHPAPAPTRRGQHA